ncbi:3,4-dihydroxy-2-butanone 4-phosphate synthase [Pseudomonas savastanoi]|uniref:3,4-dihydroxy-2-butanone 4-phosphate synthase n=1 Tax=Pseudomonas savastanoi TaxID=29438 RepID=A0A3M6A3U8_PSESS|nr:3,4-dihydroxy-2-butanone 4-phosphate synthase [Pseudomonas savastanoi]
MAFDRIEDIIEDYRLGKMVLLVDDEDRENEGDLLLAADCCSAQAISFMAREARGLICLTLTDEHCQRLGLEQMVPSNGSVFATAFTVSIEATTGVTTGISAADRARTVQAAVNPHAVPEDLVQPGHIFPLRARDGGVLTRAGHTEAGCDLARMAGFPPASVIVEVMNDDGTMARRPDLELFAEKHGIRIGTIADLIHYRLSTEHTIVRIGERDLPTVHGTFRLFSYEDRIEGGVHMAMVMGDIRRDDPTLVRVHVVDPLRDLGPGRRRIHRPVELDALGRAATGGARRSRRGRGAGQSRVLTGVAGANSATYPAAAPIHSLAIAYLFRGRYWRSDLAGSGCRQTAPPRPATEIRRFDRLRSGSD